MSTDNAPSEGSENRPEESGKRRRSPAVHFFLKGLAISLPPVLTLVILIWIGNGINDYIIAPINLLVRFSIAKFIDDPRPTDRLVYWERLPPLEYCDRRYRITPELKRDLESRLKVEAAKSGAPVWFDGDVPTEWVREQIADVYVPFGRESVPYRDYEEVAQRVRPSQMPTSATGVYMELVETRSQSQIPISVVAVAVVIVLLYFLGRIVTARVGAWVVHKFESGVLRRVPIISNVYGSVKQVTDFFFTERTVEYNRVVAVEYPRRGMWSLGFVTSDSLLEITAAAGEPLLAVLMPTSPMPMTGFTVSVPRSEVLDLNITVDQAFQFCLSCGVLVPPQQAITPELLQKELAKRFSENSHGPPYRRELPAAFRAIQQSPRQEPPGVGAPDGESGSQASAESEERS